MIKLHLKRTILFGILGLLIALGFAFMSPPVYESQTAMLVGEGQNAALGATTVTDDVAKILNRGVAGNAQTEVGVLMTRGVFYQALADVFAKTSDPDLRADPEKYYLMYNVTSERESNVAVITTQAFSPERAQEIANAVTTAYNEIRKQSLRDAVNDALQYLAAQIAASERDLREVDEQYRKFKSEKELADVPEQVNSDQRYKNQLSQLLDAAESSLAAVNGEIAVQRAKINALPKSTIDSQGFQKRPVVQAIENNITELERRLAEARSIYYDDSINVTILLESLKQQRAQLDKEKRNTSEMSIYSERPEPIRELLRNQLAQNEVRRSSIISNIESLKSNLAAQRQKVADMPGTEVNLAKLARDRDLLDGKYRNLKSQYEQIKNRTETGPRAAQVLFAATRADDPVAPDKLKLSLAGALAGLCIGLLFSFGLESLRLRVRSSAQLTELTGLPVAASVPALPKPKMARMMARLAKGDGQPAESFRYMAFTSMASESMEPKVVLFTATGSSGGRSFAAENFAVAAARARTRTLLVDLDLRRATITNMFGGDGKSGVSDILARTQLPSESDQDLSIPTPEECLRVLPAGTDRSKGLADVATNHIEAIVNSLRGKAEMIVIDAPPCDAFSDASRLAKYVDEVILVVSAKTTNFRNIPLAYEILTRSGAKNVNLVLMDASVEDEPFSSSTRSMVRT